jgi:hypothetical protein
VRDTATLVADGQTFLLDGVQGLGAPYADQLQAYITANGDSVSCKPQGAPGHYVCVLGDGTDVAKVALVNGAARAAPDAPDPYYQQQLRAYAASRGIWASLPPSPLSVPSVAWPGSDALSAAPDTLAVQPQAPVRAANREPTPTPSDDTTGQSPGLLAIAIIVGIYLLPYLIGRRRNISSLGSLFFVNVILGWTLIGWPFCLIWAATAATKAQDRFYEQAAAAPRGERDRFEDRFYNAWRWRK